VGSKTEFECSPKVTEKKKRPDGGGRRRLISRGVLGLQEEEVGVK